MRFAALQKHFSENGPPIYLTAALQAGMKLDAPSAMVQTIEELEAMLSQFPGAQRVEGLDV